MATVSELIVLVTANTTGFQSGMARAEVSTSRFATAAKVGLAIAAVAAVKFVADSVEAYQEHEKALLELQTTIDNSPALIGASTAAFEEQATALQNLTGVQDEEILKADAVLGRFDLTAQQLQEINPLILDYAQATGQDAATAAGSLGRALLGNSRALKAVGIEFTATGDRSADFSAITSALENKVGGLAETFGKTLTGKLAIASAKFDDVKEEVGKALIPVLTELADLLVNLTPVLTKVADAMKLLPLFQMSEDFKKDTRSVAGFLNILIDTIPVLGHFIDLTDGISDSLGHAAAEMFLTTDAAQGLAHSIGAVPSVGNINPGGVHPHLAAGGVVTRPTMALIGESGPEAVIPLNKANAMGGVTVNVTGWVGNDQQIAKRVRDELVKLGKRNVTTGL